MNEAYRSPVEAGGISGKKGVELFGYREKLSYDDWRTEIEADEQELRGQYQLFVDATGSAETYERWAGQADMDEDAMQRKYAEYESAWEEGTKGTTIQDLAPALRWVSGMLIRDASMEYTATTEGRHP